MLYTVNPKKSVCGDICKPLIDLWKEIRDNPESLADGYTARLDQTSGRGLYCLLCDKG